MNALYAIALVVAVALFLYLVVGLLHPEKFE